MTKTSREQREEAEKQLGAAIALLGKTVRFAHQPAGPLFRVSAVHSDGMVEIDGFSGQFAPHLFIEVK